LVEKYPQKYCIRRVIIAQFLLHLSSAGGSVVRVSR